MVADELIIFQQHNGILYCIGGTVLYKYNTNRQYKNYNLLPVQYHQHRVVTGQDTKNRVGTGRLHLPQVFYVGLGDTKKTLKMDNTQNKAI